MIRVGIVGASGYMGGEALRILLEHPEVEVAWATSRAPAPIEEFHPNLFGSGIRLVHPDEATPCDAVFLALPTAASIDEGRRFLEAGCKVIDLGAAFRLRDRKVWEGNYRQQHSDWELAEKAVYGIPELHLDEIRKANLIANPGCFASAAILGMAPLAAEGLIEGGQAFVTGLSGTAGAGAEPSRAAHHPEIGNNLMAYNVVGHRHTAEMEQELSAVHGSGMTVHFTPVYVPVVRGVLDVCHVIPTKSVRRSELLALYTKFYGSSPFVKVYDVPKEPAISWQYRPYPWVSSVAGTNYAYIGLDVDDVRGRIVVTSVLDSIGKGGAHVAVENMNLMFGFDRMTGLRRRAMHPG